MLSSIKSTNSNCLIRIKEYFLFNCDSNFGIDFSNVNLFDIKLIFDPFGCSVPNEVSEALSTVKTFVSLYMFKI